MATSLLCYPEARAAIAAGRRRRRITARQQAGALGHFEALFAELAVVGVDADLARHAGELADAARRIRTELTTGSLSARDRAERRR